MDLKNISSEFYPTYTWLWNTEITKDGIRKQIDEMYDAGIRAFYIIGESERFRPVIRRTRLKPDYLSDEYLKLLRYAYEYGTEKGMNTWLYNEGGYPSGMACGKISDVRPDLVRQMLNAEKIILPAKTAYKAPENTLSSFADSVRIYDGAIFDKETEIERYYPKFVESKIHTDVSREENTDLFIKLTHEAMKREFGADMGRGIKYMFDDEANMGTWSFGLGEKFKAKYGYDLLDYLPYIIMPTPKEATREEHYRARIDYNMLCYELIRDNYFRKMRVWLNENGMCSVGHLDNDHTAAQARIMRYGNPMSLLREFDVPGIDVIWSQITYPNEEGKACVDRNYEACQFFPRSAPSAARQMGHSKALTESCAVYGSYVAPEEMRYLVNYQAVRGISIFNFMVVSYDRSSVMCHQFRPNFIPENLGMDSLSEINDYVARLSFLLQNSKAEINTALYIPSRTITAGGKYQAESIASYEKIGNILEAAGVDFDIVDEELVLSAKVCDGALVCDKVTYKNVFVPKAEYELDEVVEKLSSLSSNIEPLYSRTNQKILARKLIFDDGAVAYFVCNTSGETVCDTLSVESDFAPSELDLFDGELYELKYERVGKRVNIPLNLLRGEGRVIYLSEKQAQAKKRSERELYREYSDLSGFVSRIYGIGENGEPKSSYPAKNEIPVDMGEWEKTFSGEVVYTVDTLGIESGDYILSLGEVRHFVKVYRDGVKYAEKTLPPYEITLKNLRAGELLTVAVSNTVANAIGASPVFDTLDIRDVGSYHADMVIREREAAPGGLIGKVALYKVK